MGTGFGSYLGRTLLPSNPLSSFSAPSPSNTSSFGAPSGSFIPPTTFPTLNTPFSLNSDLTNQPGTSLFGSTGQSVIQPPVTQLIVSPLLFGTGSSGLSLLSAANSTKPKRTRSNSDDDEDDEEDEDDESEYEENGDSANIMVNHMDTNIAQKFGHGNYTRALYE